MGQSLSFTVNTLSDPESTYCSSEVSPIPKWSVKIEEELLDPI